MPNTVEKKEGKEKSRENSTSPVGKKRKKKFGKRLPKYPDKLPINIIYRDVIGLPVQIKNRYNEKRGFFDAGTVIYETYNTIITTRYPEDPAKYDKKSKIYSKRDHIFRFKLDTPNGPVTLEVDGRVLLKRPENRLKQIKKKKKRRYKL